MISRSQYTAVAIIQNDSHMGDQQDSSSTASSTPAAKCEVNERHLLKPCVSFVQYCYWPSFTQRYDSINKVTQESFIQRKFPGFDPRVHAPMIFNADRDAAQRRCAGCGALEGKETLRVCSGCHAVWYCVSTRYAVVVAFNHGINPGHEMPIWSLEEA